MATQDGDRRAVRAARRLERGEEQRAQTRRRILQAAYRLFAERGAEAPTIDDVVARAEVARGTFYNHFAGRDILFEAVADEIAVDINARITPHVRGLTDPAERICIAFRMFTGIAIDDEAAGWVLLRTIPLVGPLNQHMSEMVVADFEAGFNGGRFRGASTSTLVSLALGMMVMTIHRLLVSHDGEDHIGEAAETLLLALGLDGDEARALVRKSASIGKAP